MTERTQAQIHRDALADTHNAYSAFHGWRLTCLWCDYYTVGQTKAKALSRMQEHYNRVLPEGADLR